MKGVPVLPDDHICGVITGEKAVVTCIPAIGGIGWILPCEVFKNRPVLMGVHCPNIDSISFRDALNSDYFQKAKDFFELWVDTGACYVETCLGQWILKITKDNGDMLDSVKLDDYYGEIYKGLCEQGRIVEREGEESKDEGEGN